MTGRNLNTVISSKVKPLIAAIRNSLKEQGLQRIALSTVVIGGLSVMTNASAEESVDANATNVDSTNNGIETIVVTSRKRVENIQETPVSITAFGTEKLEETWY